MKQKQQQPERKIGSSRFWHFISEKVVRKHSLKPIEARAGCSGSRFTSSVDIIQVLKQGSLLSGFCSVFFKYTVHVSVFQRSKVLVSKVQVIPPTILLSRLKADLFVIVTLFSRRLILIRWKSIVCLFQSQLWMWRKEAHGRFCYTGEKLIGDVKKRKRVHKNVKSIKAQSVRLFLFDFIVMFWRSLGSQRNENIHKRVIFQLHNCQSFCYTT